MIFSHLHFFAQEGFSAESISRIGNERFESSPRKLNQNPAWGKFIDNRRTLPEMVETIRKIYLTVPEDPITNP